MDRSDRSLQWGGLTRRCTRRRRGRPSWLEVVLNGAAGERRSLTATAAIRQFRECRDPRQIFRASRFGISVCRGMASTAPVAGLVHSKCASPSRLSTQPWRRSSDTEGQVFITGYYYRNLLIANFRDSSEASS